MIFVDSGILIDYFRGNDTPVDRLKKKGISVPFQDAAIATICIVNDIPLLSKDSHFEIIAKVLDGLRLYKFNV
jgi:hypothetical protein